jgi:arylsulfatase A-like enzyme
MSRNIRLLIVFLCASLGALVVLGFANARVLGGAGFYAGLDALVKRAVTVREAAHPDYQREALSAMATNPMVGSVVRLDDSMDAARIIEEPQRTDAYAAFENVFAYEFDQAELAPPPGDAIRTSIRDGVLVAVQAGKSTGKGYLRNAQPIAIEAGDIGEVVIRARAREGKQLTLGWSHRPDPVKYAKLEIPLIADGEFHNYFINARNAFTRGLSRGEPIRFLAVRPSDVDGDEVEIDFIRFLSTRSRYMRKPRDVLYETIAGEMRPVLSMLPRQTLEFSAHIPENEPRLSFGTAIIGKDSRIHFKVQLVSDATTTELHSQVVDAPGAWRDASYDLRPWAGREVAVRLSVEGEVGSVGLWSSPCIYGRPARPFRVVILLEDAERPDHLSVYGYDKPTSPFKEELLRDQGAVFLRALSQDSVTRASVPSMMTSLLPSVTGVWNFSDMLPPDFLTLAEVLRQQGFATASFVQNNNAGAAAGLHQGFDVAADQAGRDRADALLESASLWNWFRGHKDRNFFLYLHITDPHGPYDPPAPYDGLYRALTNSGGPQARNKTLDPSWVSTPTREGRIALYDGEIRHNDEVLRRFFARLKDEGLFEDTLFVFIADHGEHFGEHGAWGHGPPGHVQVTGVPMILLYPQRIPEPMRITEIVQLLDVMPTVLEFAGVDAHGLAMQGDSLVSLLEGRRPEFWRNRVIASEEAMTRDRVDPRRNRGLRASGSFFYRDWHLIASRMFWPRRGYWPESLRLKVFNLTDDPHEERAKTRFLPDAYLRYRYTSDLNRLQVISEEAGRLFRSSQEQDYEFDPDTLKHLKALGYVE